MSRITKKYLSFLIGFFILFSFTCFSEAISTTQQKQAEEWFNKAYNTDDLRLKIEYYSKAIELNPKHIYAFNNRGLAYMSLGEFQNAIDDFNTVIKIDSKLPYTYYNRGLVYIRMGEYQKAIDDFSKAIELGKTVEIDFNLSHPYSDRGVAYSKLGEYQKAIDDYNKAIEIDPKNAYAYSNRGNCYVNLGEYHKAIFEYNKAIKLAPEYAQAYLNRGIAYKRLQGFNKEACADFYQAGILFLEQNNKTKALSCLEQIKETDPSSPLIDELMKQINP